MIVVGEQRERPGELVLQQFVKSAIVQKLPGILVEWAVLYFLYRNKVFFKI